MIGRSALGVMEAGGWQGGDPGGPLLGGHYNTGRTVYLAPSIGQVFSSHLVSEDLLGRW